MIEKYDKNFAAMPNLPDVEFYDAKRDARFSVHGLLGFESDGTLTRIPQKLIATLKPLL